MRKMTEMTINNCEELLERVQEFGVLPLFGCGIPGLSASDMTPRSLWFSDEDGGLGLWDWKAPAIMSRRCAYGQFFGGKMGFVSLEMLPDFLAWRRAAKRTCDEDKAAIEEAVLQVIEVAGAATKADIRTSLGFNYKRASAGDPVDDRAIKKLSLDPMLSDLQMQGKVVISSITRRINRSGEEDRYGWQIAHYSTPEEIFGRDSLASSLSPAEAHEKLTGHVASLLPSVDVAKLRRLI